MAFLELKNIKRYSFYISKKAVFDERFKKKLLFLNKMTVFGQKR